MKKNKFVGARIDDNLHGRFMQSLIRLQSLEGRRITASELVIEMIDEFVQHSESLSENPRT